MLFADVPPGESPVAVPVLAGIEPAGSLVRGVNGGVGGAMEEVPGSMRSKPPLVPINGRDEPIVPLGNPPVKVNAWTLAAASTRLFCRGPTLSGWVMSGEASELVGTTARRHGSRNAWDNA
jgi:hypothetical protein